MAKPVLYSFLAAALILFSNKLFAQGLPNISYPASSYIYRVGTAIATLSPSNSGGAVFASYTTPSSFVNIGNAAVTVTLDASGNVYSADFTGKRILKWNSSASGGPINTTTTNGPAGIVVDGLGNIYVGDKTNHNVYQFNSAGTLTNTITLFNTPEGLACDASNNIYVADDAAGNVVKIAAGTLTKTQTWTGFASFPYGITVFGNDIYVSESTPGTIIKIANGVTGSTTQTTFATGFSTPRYLTDDGGGNIYVADLGSNSIKKITPGGVVSTIITGGLTSPRDVAVNSSGVFYIANNGSNDIVTSSPPYSISPMSLPAGLNFDSVTGTITGTPTAVTASTTYTITGHNASGSNSTTINITCYSQLAWNGATNAWGLNTNWTPAVVPTSLDPVSIGSTTTFTLAPVITANAAAASIVMGTLGGHAATITVTGAAVSLTVPGDITYQSDASSQSSGFTAAFSGTGTISANNINIIANTNLTSYTEALTSSVANLNLSGNLNFTTSWTSAANTDNASFSLTGGTMTMTGINTTNANTSNVATIATSGSSALQFTGTAALSGLSGIGTNTITLGGATIGYTGNNNQTVYTNAAIANSSLTTGISYTNLTFSGTTGVKTALSGSLNVSGNFTNSLTSNATTTYVDLSSPTVNFTGGSAQALAGGTGTGTKFYNVVFSGAGTKTMSGIFSVASSGVLTMSGAVTTLNAGSGVLTLNSDATGSATVAQITPGSTITGNVTAQRFVQGGSASLYRGYRNMSSPISSTGTTGGLVDLSYIPASTFVTGAVASPVCTLCTVGGNPSLFLYREDLPVINTSFVSGNFVGVTDINGTALKTSSGNPPVAGTATLPAGSGFYLFFRGDRTNPSGKTTPPYVAAENVTFSTSGKLNQGNIVVADWYGSAALSRSATASIAQGFHLVGNPYASSIDWDTYTAGTAITHTNINGTIHIYNTTLKTYATYVAGSSGIGTNMPNSAVHNANVIPSGEGFFVQVATAGTGALTFTEAAKTNSQQATSTNLLLSAAPVGFTAPQYLRIQLKKDSVNNEDALLFFNSTASTAFVDNEDGPYLKGGSSLTFSTMSSDQMALAVNKLPFPKLAQTRVPLNVNATSPGPYSLSLSEAVNIPALFDVWLMDAFNKDSVDIKHNPTYNFDITGNAASSDPKRFTLVIRQNTANAYHLLSFNGSKATGGSQLNWTTENEENYTTFTVERSANGGTFTALDVEQATGGGSYSYLDQNPVGGLDLYRLKQVDVNGTITYSNVVQLQYSNLSNTPLANGNINIFPNPVKDAINLNIVTANSAPATYNISITNSNGYIVKTFTSQQTVWQNNISDLTPGMYVIKVINNTDNSVVGTNKFIKL